MPYRRMYRRKTYGKRRSTYRRRPAAKTSGWGTAINYAGKALRLATKVAAVVNTEYKYFYQTGSAIALNNAGVYATLFNVAQGTTALTRTGDSVKLKNLTIRGLLNLTGGLNEECRVIIYWDKENIINTGALMLSNAGTTLATMSAKYEDNKYDTKILYDQTFKMTANYPLQKFEKEIPINNHVHWAAGTTTIKNGALCMLVFSQNPANTGLSYIARTSFVDN